MVPTPTTEVDGPVEVKAKAKAKPTKEEDGMAMHTPHWMTYHS